MKKIYNINKKNILEVDNMKTIKEFLEDELYGAFEDIAEMVSNTRGYYDRQYLILSPYGVYTSPLGENYLEADEIILAKSFPANYTGDYIDEMNWDEEEEKELGYTALEILQGFVEDLNIVYDYIIDPEKIQNYIMGVTKNGFF